MLNKSKRGLARLTNFLVLAWCPDPYKNFTLKFSQIGPLGPELWIIKDSTKIFNVVFLSSFWYISNFKNNHRTATHGMFVKILQKPFLNPMLGNTALLNIKTSTNLLHILLYLSGINMMGGILTKNNRLKVPSKT